MFYLARSGHLTCLLLWYLFLPILYLPTDGPAPIDPLSRRNSTEALLPTKDSSSKIEIARGAECFGRFLRATQCPLANTRNRGETSQPPATPLAPAGGFAGPGLPAARNSASQCVYRRESEPPAAPGGKVQVRHEGSIGGLEQRLYGC